MKHASISETEVEDPDSITFICVQFGSNLKTPGLQLQRGRRDYTYRLGGTMRFLPFACFNHFAFTLTRVWQCPNFPPSAWFLPWEVGFLGATLSESSMIEGALRILLRPWWRTFESEC